MFQIEITILSGPICFDDALISIRVFASMMVNAIAGLFPHAPRQSGFLVPTIITPYEGFSNIRLESSRIAGLRFGAIYECQDVFQRHIAFNRMSGREYVIARQSHFQ